MQNQTELDQFYEQYDPWEYESNADDQQRKKQLLDSLSNISPRNVLDIACGHGFITRELPGETVLGIDLSVKAIEQAQNSTTDKRVRFEHGDCFTVADRQERFDLIVITGLLYDQYVERGFGSLLTTIDRLLSPSGYLLLVHVQDWLHERRFPYTIWHERTYPYRNYVHHLQLLRKDPLLP